MNANDNAILSRVTSATNLIISGALRDYDAHHDDKEALAAILQEIQMVCDQWGENFANK